MITQEVLYFQLPSMCISGKIVPTNCLWVGNIPMNVKRRDLEQAFSRYGDFKSFDYATGDPAAIVTYNEIEDAIKARAKLTGVTQITDGRKVRSESGHSDSSRRGKEREEIVDRGIRASSSWISYRLSRSSHCSSVRHRSSARHDFEATFILGFLVTQSSCSKSHPRRTSRERQRRRAERSVLGLSITVTCTRQ